MSKRAKRCIEVWLMLTFAVSHQQTQPCEMFNRAEKISETLGVLEYLSFQAAQWLLAIAICNTAASRFCWKTCRLWHLILQIGAIFQRKGLQADATGNSSSSQGRNIDWEYPSQKSWGNFYLNYVWILWWFPKTSQYWLKFLVLVFCSGVLLPVSVPKFSSS